MGRALPLSGLRVLDLASFIAGPVATTVMGDYGAEVIKIEPPGEGDPQRKLGQVPSIPQHPVNFCWHLVNRNKRAIVLDLKHEEGRGVFDRLVKTADVMVVNFPLKVRARLRMRYADVAPLNPRLIYASMTGYGEHGPDAEQPGFDSTAFFARSGLLDALTHEGGPPAFSLPAQGDQMAGMNLFAAISMALLHRERTGEGSEVSTSLHAGGLWSNAMLAQGALLDAFVAPRPPRTTPRSALANQYRTSDGRWIQLTIAREDKLWPGICAGRSGAPTCWPTRASRPPTCGAATPPSWRRSSIRSSPRIPGPSGASACATTRSPSGCSACCATCLTTNRR